jgi:uncharacterized membrane protein YkvA (DUF1232 family)
MENPSSHFSDSRFWDTVRRIAKRAGSEVIEEAITLYHCLRDPDTPAWARATIAGALGYFILPTDLIPDFIPVVGFTDDLGVFVAASACVAIHIKPEHRERAQRQIETWFGVARFWRQA